MAAADAICRLVLLERVARFRDRWSWHHLSRTLPLRVLLAAPRPPLRKLDWERALRSGGYSLADVRGIFATRPPCYELCMHVRLASLDEVLLEPFPWSAHALCRNGTLDVAGALRHAPSLTFELSFAALSANPSLTFEHVELLPDAPWDWAELSRSPRVSLDIVLRLESKPWSRCHLSRNPAIDLERVLQDGPRHGFWDWRALGDHPRLTGALLERFADAPWDWAAVSRNRALEQPRVALRHPEWPWSWRDLSAHCAAFPVRFMLQNARLGWDLTRLSREGRLRSEDVIRSAASLPWDFRELSRNANLADGLEPLLASEAVRRRLVPALLSANPLASLPLVLAYPGLRWSFKRLSENASIAVRDVCSRPDLPWFWDRVSARAQVDDVVGFPDLPWCWRAFSAGRASFREVEGRPELPWNWAALSSIAGLSFDDVARHRERPWNWRALSGNPSVFRVAPADLLAYVRRRRAAGVIKRQWLASVNDPRYACARRRLLALWLDEPFISSPSP